MLMPSVHSFAFRSPDMFILLLYIFLWNALLCFSCCFILPYLRLLKMSCRSRQWLWAFSLVLFACWVYKVFCWSLCFNPMSCILGPVGLMKKWINNGQWFKDFKQWMLLLFIQWVNVQQDGGPCEECPSLWKTSSFKRLSIKMLLFSFQRPGRSLPCCSAMRRH